MLKLSWSKADHLGSLGQEGTPVFVKRDTGNAILNTFSKTASAIFYACTAPLGVTLLR